jgi:type IV pilus assembly protein PilY1
MKTPTNALSTKFARVLPAAMLAAACAAQAATADIYNAPLSSSARASVLPNLMFVLDDSGSMDFDVLPDFVDDSGTCKRRSGNNTDCNAGDPPYYSAQFNSSFYNPQITYSPPVNFDGTSFGNQGSPWTSVKVNAFTSSSTINLTNSFREIRYCNSEGTDCKRNGIDTPNPFEYRSGTPDNGTLGYPDAFSSSTPLGNNVTISKTSNNSTATVTINNHGLTSGSLVQITGCQGSGGDERRIEPEDNPTTVTIVNTNQFRYTTDRSGTYIPAGNCDFAIVTLAHDQADSINTNPHYYTITPIEHCSDANLTTCVASTTPSGASNIPALVRYCKSTALAHGAAPVTGSSSGSVNCQSTYTNTYKYPRYGKFTRTDIVPTTLTYGSRPGRIDCASAPTCTYAEEMTNFSNWYAYYRTRMQMMKSAAGRAFLPIDDRYRVGFLTINPTCVNGSSTCGSTVRSEKYLKIDEFDAAHKEAWYKQFYDQLPRNGTPLREALARVGRHYAGVSSGINSGMPDDPMQYSCQQNFTILTTDGYWNGSAGQTTSGGSIGNQDNVDSGLSSRASGSFDGNLSGASDTLADVAMYYYKTDLRGTGSIGSLGTDVSKNNVPVSSKDTVAHQHMTTFSLGIVDGLMTYRPDYESATLNNDFNAIKTGASGCLWASGTCNWPVPSADSLSALDDLWHAAVNGRGTFYQAKDPNSVADGLSSALAGLNARTAAAAASATSSPNITPTDRSIFSSTYTTMEWSGQVVAQDIDPATGNVVPAIKWSAQSLLDAKVSTTTDTRTIYLFDSTVPTTKLKSFLWADMTAAEQAYVSNKCVPTSNLSQCIVLTAPQLVLANDGQNMVNFLRGHSEHEGGVYRDRLHVLGDTVNATPAYMREPRFAFADAVTPDYASFKSANASRQATLFIAANDGMLHAFNADSGQEMWAYVPKMVLPNMYKLAEDNYATKHQYFVDGSPELMDIYVGGAWKTILVAGLNSGGRGYYALDVTNPASPKGLWEICSDSALCAISDTDLGLSYGNPVITKRPSDGKWVVLVTSGYNNVSPGTGRGFLFVLDAATGAILSKVDTGTGDTTTPSGLGKISVWADNGNSDNTGKYVYAGDLRGNVWQFDFTAGATPTVSTLGTLTDSTGRPQSVTTRPELGLVQGHRVLFIGTGRYLGVSDLQDPSTWVPASTDAYQNTLYAIKDKGTDYGNIRSAGGLIEQTINVVSPTLRSSSTNPVDWGTNNGWYIDFNPSNDSPGERVNIDPQLALGTLVVVTNVPSNDACTIGGESWVYQFNYESGQYLLTSPNQAVATKLGNAVTVGIVIVRLPSGQLKAIATDAAGGKSPFGVNIGGGTASGKRTSWREIVR